jgi:hypothetical protein
MTKRVLLAGLLGGLAMFVWASLAHTVLGLGRIGFQEIPNEQTLMAAMQTQLDGNSGLYFFPGSGLPAGATREQQNAAMQQYDQRLATNPSGILIYHPPGAKALTPQQLTTEFLTECIEAILVCFLLSQTRLTSFGSKVFFFTIAGIVASITTNLPYWNWYGFPTNYTTAYMSIQIVDYILAGIVAALVMKGAADGRSTA